MKDKMDNSQRMYLISKLRKECKIYYFRNGLNLDKKVKNPLEMDEIELMVFIDKYNLDSMYVNILNDTVNKFLEIYNKLGPNFSWSVANVLLRSQRKQNTEKILKELETYIKNNSSLFSVKNMAADEKIKINRKTDLFYYVSMDELKEIEK